MASPDYAIDKAFKGVEATGDMAQKLATVFSESTVNQKRRKEFRQRQSLFFQVVEVT